MGHGPSSMAKGDIAYLQNCTHCTIRYLAIIFIVIIVTSFIVSLEELEELYRRFERLDRDRSGTLSAEEILGIPEFSMNPLAPRLIELLRVEEEELDFAGFAELMSVFHPRAPARERLELSFRMFNVSNDGQLKREDLQQIMQMMAGHNLEEEELQLMVERTLQILDCNHDGVVDFDEFAEVPNHFAFLISKSNNMSYVDYDEDQCCRQHGNCLLAIIHLNNLVDISFLSCYIAMATATCHCWRQYQ